jgi:hypothetical protein
MSVSVALGLVASQTSFAQKSKSRADDTAPSWAMGASIPVEQFDRTLTLICPQPGESKWAQLPWMWNLEEARKKAVDADKPLLFWRAGGGDPLGRV